MSKAISTAILLLMLAPADALIAKDRVTVSGLVRDSLGAVVVEAEVRLLNPQQTIVAATRTDVHGRFEFAGVPRGSYLLAVGSRGFAERRVAILVGRSDPESIAVTLEPQAIHQQITVTAHPGLVEDIQSVPQPVNVVDMEKIRERAKAVVAQVAGEEVGVHLQRTSPTIAGVFVRGLTGNKVNVFVDGVRFSTSAARSGIQTFLDLLEPSSLEAVEILRGPNSAQYGSDSLGGTVQFVSRAPSFSTGSARLSGSFDTFFNSADASFGSGLSAGYGSSRFGLLVNVAGRRTSTLRTGGGVDSHAAVTRFLGLRSDALTPGRLPDTAFTQYGGLLKLNWSPAPGSQLMAHYSRSQQDGGKRYDQLLGGDGNLIADLRNLMLDFFYVRYDKARAGWFDHFSATYSFNSQREERVNQGGNGNPQAAIVHEYERTNANGIQGWANKQWGAAQNLLVGGEYYRERIRAPSFAFNPVTHLSSLRRPRVPDRARYQSGGLYLQDVVEVKRKVLRVVGNVRYSAASYRARAGDSPIVSGARLWSDDSLAVSDVTFRTGLVVTPRQGWSLSANLSRGFRAPHVTDLGTLGLTGSGFEVAAPDLAGMGATIASTAGTSAVSTGRPVLQVKPESSLSFETGARYRSRRLESALAFFVNDIKENITKQALILPSGAVGRELGGQAIVAQNPNGMVFVAAATNPVLVRANFGSARIRGLEHTLDAGISPRWSVATVFTYLHAADKRTGLPPNIEGGTPAPDGYLKIRYVSRGGHLWLEPYLHAADRQERLSSLNLEDRRVGAGRSRENIRNFFLNGATVRGLVRPGPDGRLGTADDQLALTGETLARVQDRVLGPGVASAPLFRAIPGYVTIGLRGGFRIGERQQVMLDLENIGDRNYRGMSWGLDAPGRSFSFRYQRRF